MLLPAAAVLVGLVLLIWGADRFVEGAASAARHFGMPPLLIGMVIVGFGTSAPEMVVSAQASLQGNPAIALGNAYGSNITNIALILGLTALISPIAVQSKVLRKELPILLGVTLLSAWQIWDLTVTATEAWVLLGAFFLLMGWSIWQGLRKDVDTLGSEVEQELNVRRMALKPALIWLVFGLLLVVLSSRLLVWGAVEIARAAGVSDLVIGLTIIAIGTSLPELASSVIAARKGEHDLAFGNVLGSNLFNTMAVVGIAGAIQPIGVAPEVLHRDLLMMVALTLILLPFGIGFKGQGRINRAEGSALLASYLAYMAWLGYSTLV
jgi:cation:H+ antiporter